MSAILVTGAGGLIGLEAIPRMLRADPRLHVFALVRSPDRAVALASLLDGNGGRLTFVAGDVTRPGLGLDVDMRRRLRSRVSAVLHLAADTSFSRPLEQARAVNTAGTAEVLALAAECRARVTFVSTAFVAGARTGAIAEGEAEGEEGWINAYERSKWEAEALVRASGLAWCVLRPSTVVCDAATGAVRQVNAVHRALRVYHRGLAAMMPGSAESPVDVVPSDWVGAAVAALARREDADGETLHLCAGTGAMPLAELLDASYAVWARDAGWKRRGIERPVLTDLATYRLFEASVAATGEPLLRRVIASLSHFVPQLALPKRFETARADAVLGASAPPVRDYWPRMIAHLLETQWCGAPLAAA